MNHRVFINNLGHTGAKKILKLIKANYKIEFKVPLNLEKNTYIFMSNHQSLIDIPLLMAAVKGTVRPVTKSELFRIPIFGRAMKLANASLCIETIPLCEKNLCRLPKRNC